MTRRPWLAPILAFLMPGLGHLYGGKPRRAFAAFIVLPAVLAIAGWSGWLYRLPSFYVTACILILLIVIQIVDAYFVARRNMHLEKTWHARWYGLIGASIAGLFLFQLTLKNRITLFNYETYRVPSSAMSPTIEKGDLFLAKPVSSGDISRGRIIVFRFPRDPSLIYIKRIAALPGDSIELVDGHVFVNGKEMVASYLYRDERVKYPEVADFIKMTVPKGGVFVLGDNLYKSEDSRFWGVVPFDNIIATPTYVWASPDAERAGKLIQSID